MAKGTGAPATWMLGGVVEKRTTKSKKMMQDDEWTSVLMARTVETPFKRYKMTRKLENWVLDN